MDDGFRIALGAEAMAGAFQPLPQGAEVVDLAVEDDPHRAVFVAHRLPSAGEVEDGQPAVSQGDAGQRVALGDVLALAVRPAMAQHGDHPLERFGPQGLGRISPNRAGDAAHGKGPGTGDQGLRPKT